MALVTGGSRGIGRAVAEALLADGNFDVAVLSRADTACKVGLEKKQSEESGSNLIGDHRSHTSPLLSLKCDVRQSTQVARAFQEAETHFGAPVSVLVNAAGVSIDSLLARASDEDISNVVQTNLIGSLYSSRTLVQGLLRRRWQRGGAIVSISSIVGHTHGDAGQVVYAASKAGLLGMTRSLAREVSPRGIRVNAVAPGLIRTDMTDSLLSSLRGAQILSQIPLQRVGTAAEVADTVLFLIRSEYITGQVFTVDGGLSL